MTDNSTAALATWSGRVLPGKGKARILVPELDLADQIGYTPYPGTLNLILERPVFLRAPQVSATNPRGKTYDLWPALLDGHPVHLWHGRQWGAVGRRVEAIAPIRLRDVVDDPLTLRIPPEWIRA